MRGINTCVSSLFLTANETLFFLPLFFILSYVISTQDIIGYLSHGRIAHKVNQYRSNIERRVSAMLNVTGHFSRPREQPVENELHR